MCLRVWGFVCIRSGVWLNSRLVSLVVSYTRKKIALWPVFVSAWKFMLHPVIWLRLHAACADIIIETQSFIKYILVRSGESTFNNGYNTTVSFLDPEFNCVRYFWSNRRGVEKNLSKKRCILPMSPITVWSWSLASDGSLVFMSYRMKNHNDDVPTSLPSLSLSLGTVHFFFMCRMIHETQYKRFWGRLWCGLMHRFICMQYAEYVEYLHLAMPCDDLPLYKRVHEAFREINETQQTQSWRKPTNCIFCCFFAWCRWNCVTCSSRMQFRANDSNIG